MYKIETCIPKSCLETIRKVLLDYDAGHIGNYKGCLIYYPITGIWYSTRDANPTVGAAGEWSKAVELKVDVIVDDELVKPVVLAIKEAHPYEEPVINIIHLEDISRFS